VGGEFELPGVAGGGAQITLDFLEPGGAVTGRLLPTGRPRDVVDGVEASLVDATNPMVFVRARDFKLSGTEAPAAIDGDRALGARLETIRVEAARLMGVPQSPAVPKIIMVAPAVGFATLDGRTWNADAVSLVARVISMGNCHRAVALTSAMCLAVAARIAGTIVHECVASGSRHRDIKLGHPSGVLPIDASVAMRDGQPYAERVRVYRTARRLMEGFVRVP
jgi:2-methylaconitate cis-trans-isomerase PrpF